ncbi:MAG: peptidylprolyl isomerase [Ignavibacteria bacterium]|nr:peptidylprolyl isomerase [Ignavibacteria bacterium]
MLKRNNKVLIFSRIIIFISYIWAFNTFSQPFTSEEKQILKIQDSRDYSQINKITEFLTEAESKTYLRAIIALGSMQDSGIIKLAGELLNSDIDKHHLIAWLLGNIRSKEGISYLIEYLSKPLSDKSLALIALGKTGDETSVDKFLQYSPYNGYELFEAYTIAFYAIRKIRKEELFKVLKELYQSPSGEKSLNGIAYSFYRGGDKILLEPYRDILLKICLAHDPNAETRMWAFSALGKLQDTSFTELLLNELNQENDWRVRVNIVSALGSTLPHINSPLTEKLVNVLIQQAEQDNSTHVSIVCLQSLGRLFADADTKNPILVKVKEKLLFLISSSFKGAWNIQAEVIKTYGKIFKDEAKNDLMSFLKSTNNYDLKSAAVSAFEYMNDPLVYKELRQTISDDVQKYNSIHPNKDGSMIGSNDLAKLYRAFAGTLSELDDKMDNENRNIIRLIYSEFASSKDAPLTDICLSSLQDSLFIEYREETCRIMMFDFSDFKLPKDKDVMLMYIALWDKMKYEPAAEILTNNISSDDYDIAKASADALKNISGEDLTSKITASRYRLDHDWNFIDNLNYKKFALIKTSKGEIKIELYTKIAPFTVQNFIKLSESGFYNNTEFHRVVPNFVIQGGDPTGTGFGGPGYTIRSEFSPMPFDEYTLGMASSGKDTEGSQFFLTHSAQPHLDGKYTVFGKVIAGTEAVDRIQIGDKIESITFSEEN